jgi:dihydropteroate synthase
MKSWSVRGKELSLDKPLVMGILNTTPDSFSDGGKYYSSDAAVARAEEMLAEGADIIDVGGESTRPGAAAISEEDELRRVIPVVRGIATTRPDATISIDTTKTVVARAAIEAGAHIVNDVSGLRFDPAIAGVCATTRAGLVLMHSRGDDVTELASFEHASYGDVVGDVQMELNEAFAIALEAGVAREAIALDPGIGFAKRGEHSLSLLSCLPTLVALGYPVMVGVSNKRFIGDVTGVRDPARRTAGTLGANVSALVLGARIFRVHEVRPAREALDVAWAILQGASAGAAHQGVTVPAADTHQR